MSKKRLATVLLVLAALAAAQPALACAVCFGNSDSEMARGVEASVLFMMATTYFLIGGGFVAFVMLRLRARRRSLAAEIQ